MKEQLNLNEERNLSIQTQLRVKDDTIKRLENKIKTLVDTKSIAIKLQPTDSRSEIRHSLAPISPVKFSPLSGNNFESKTFCQGQNKKLKSKTRKSKIKSQAEKFAGVNYDSLLSMLICQSQMFEETCAAANNNSYSSPYKPQGRHIKNLSPISSNLKENRIISSNHSNRSNIYGGDQEFYKRIVKAFQDGNDEKAISLWRTVSYCQLPIEDSSKYYSLALKLKDIQLLDLENNFHSNRTQDRTIAYENEKLKLEIKNLADAIDSIMRENDNKKHSEYSQDLYSLKQEVENLKVEIDSKNYQIKDLESKIIRKELIESTKNETETRGIRQEDAMYYNSGNTTVENHMIELESLICRIEATLFSFESSNTAFISPMKSMNNTKSTNGMCLDAMVDFCKRLERIDSVVEKLIETSLRKDQSRLNDTFNHASNSPVQKCDDDTEECIERKAENLLTIADQKYKKYFESCGVDEQIRKDSAFKDLFNLNHQIIKCLQMAENKANCETLKAQRSKRILQEIDTIFREEGRRNMNREIKILNDKLITENDDLIQECVSLKNEIERFQSNKLNTLKSFV